PPKRTPFSKAFVVESCATSSSLPIPARNKEEMQPSPPPGVSSRTPPQFEQVEISCGAGCICQTSAWPRRGTNIAVLRPRLRLQTPYRARLRVESHDNVCAIGRHRCV